MRAMLASAARVPTALPRRYLGQLCKHFQHKLAVTLTEDSGSIAFPMGPCALSIQDDALVMRVEAADAAGWRLPMRRPSRNYRTSLPGISCDPRSGTSWR